MGLNRIINWPIDWLTKLIVDVIVWWTSSRYKRERLHIENTLTDWHENMNQHRQKFHEADTQATTAAQTIAMSAMTPIAMSAMNPSQFRGYLGISGYSGVSGFSGYSGYIAMDETNSIVYDPTPQLDLPHEMDDWENACSVCHMTGVPLIKFSKSDELYCRDCISKLKGGS